MHGNGLNFRHGPIHRAMMGQYIMIHFPQHELREVEQRKLLSRYFNRMVGFHILPPEKGVYGLWKNLLESCSA